MYRSFISTADSCNEDYAHRAVGVKVCKESASEFWHTSRILPRWQSHPWPRHTTELPSSPASRYCPCGDPPDASSRVDSRADPVKVDFGGVKFPHDGNAVYQDLGDGVLKTEALTV